MNTTMISFMKYLMLFSCGALLALTSTFAMAEDSCKAGCAISQKSCEKGCNDDDIDCKLACSDTKDNCVQNCGD